MADMCSVPTAILAVTLTIPVPTSAAATTTPASIAATTGTATCTTATIPVSGITPDSMAGATIPGASTLPGGWGYGVGEERRGMASTAAGSRLIPTMPGRRSGSPII